MAAAAHGLLAAPLAGGELLVSCMKIGVGRLSAGVYASTAVGELTPVAVFGRDATWNHQHTAIAYRLGSQVVLRENDGTSYPIYDGPSIASLGMPFDLVVRRTLVWSGDDSRLALWRDSPLPWTPATAPVTREGIAFQSWQARVVANVLPTGRPEPQGGYRIWPLGDPRAPLCHGPVAATGGDGAVWLAFRLAAASWPRPAELYAGPWSEGGETAHRLPLDLRGELVGLAADPRSSRIAVDVAISESERRTVIVDLASGSSVELPFDGSQRCRMHVQEWSPDARALLVIVETDQCSEAWMFNTPAGETPSQALRYYGLPNAHQMVWSPDGSRIAVLAGSFSLLQEDTYREVTIYQRNGDIDGAGNVDVPEYLQVDSIDW